MRDSGLLSSSRWCGHYKNRSPAAAQTQTPDLFGDRALWCWALAMTYFLTGNPQYHRRDVVSRSCSGWEGVGPTRYGRQEFWDSKVELDCVLHRVAIA